MNKSKRTILIVVIIWLIAAVVIGISIMANKEKTPISANQFKNVMTQKGYEITDATSQFAQYDYVKQVYVAGNSYTSYQIEFYELADETTALGFYNNNATTFQNQKSSSSAETNVNGKNHSKYTLSSSGKYMVVSRIDNTVVYLSVNDTYKDEVKSILKELGY